MPYKEHPVFIKPDNENIKIWRYLDFTKFVSLLEKKSLFFCRADKLGDPFEGSYPKINAKLRPKIYKDVNTSQELEELAAFHERVVKFIAINCWHMNNYESVAMWRLYLKSNEGIAITSNFIKLRKCFINVEPEIYVGKVVYIDYEVDWLPEGNIFYPFVHKRKVFEYEQELRALILGDSKDKSGPIDKLLPPFEDGLYIPVNLDILVDKVYVAPTCPQWFFEIVKSIMNKYELDKEIIQSSLDVKPLY